MYHGLRVNVPPYHGRNLEISRTRPELLSGELLTPRIPGKTPGLIDRCISISENQMNTPVYEAVLGKTH